MIRLNVGLNKKIGEPNYGSRGASINLDVELATGDLEDTAQLQARIRGLYDLAREALVEELDGEHSADARNTNGHARGQDSPRGRSIPHPGGNGRGNGGNGNGHHRSDAAMTASQRRAISAIAGRLGIDPAEEIRSQFGLGFDRLSIAQASRVIDHLKALQTAGSNGGAR